MREFWAESLRISLALLAAFLLTLLVVLMAHGSPKDALAALWSGAFGSRYDFGNTLAKMTPLLLTGLGVSLAFRARMWNVGGEGQFLVGALAASALGAYSLKHLPSAILVPFMMLGGAFAGAVWAGLAGWMKVARGVPEVISTIMLNFIAAQILSYLVHGPMQGAGSSQPASESLLPNATLPVIIPQTTVTIAFLIALVVSVAVAAFLYRTPGGFGLRVVGANSEAARVAGIPVERTLMSAMCWSGALCGLAGALELSGVVGTLYENYAPGYGFTAVAVALLGRLNPYGIIASALFFGALTAGSGSMERQAGISPGVIGVMQAIALLALLGVPALHFSKRLPAATKENT